MRGRCNSIVKRVVRSTSVPIADLSSPMMRSPSQWPGTARSVASAGRALIITCGVTMPSRRCRARARGTLRSGLHAIGGTSNRRARLQGRQTPRATKVIDRPREDWVHIPVPAIVDTDTFERVALRLADNKRFASRNSRVPSLLQGLAACERCGYGYYRCLGSDDYRYEGGRVCANKPVRADYLDQVVWEHITGLPADPHLIRAEIDKRLHAARSADPNRRQR